MIIQGDCLTEMAKMEANSISGIVTDPPYGLSFMNKGWDHGIPGEAYWKEALRICKPGSHLLAFGGTRTFHRLTCAIEDAGWDIRDCISWLYGSGFPKSHNHFGFPGYGTALKPAWEPILVCMKPCDGTFARNAEKWGQAGINIDTCRIGTEEIKTCAGTIKSDIYGIYNNPMESMHKGRWPANLILDEEAAAMLDEQSGITRSSGGRSGNDKAYGGSWKQNYYGDKTPGLGDIGGASRFFYCAKASSAERNRGCEGLPEVRGGTERMNNSDGRKEELGESDRLTLTKNNHPTVKPLKLMEYLVKLIAPPKDAIILDPFAGSGTTLLACQNLRINFVGIEMSADYCEIARARLWM